MDWNVANRTAKEMLDVGEKNRATMNAELVTMVAAMLMVVISLDASTADLPNRPDDLVQLYGWAQKCFAAIQLAFPENPKKPN